MNERDGDSAKAVVRRQIDGFSLPDHVAALKPKLEHWADLLTSSEADAHKESQLLPDFLTALLGVPVFTGIRIQCDWSGRCGWTG